MWQLRIQRIFKKHKASVSKLGRGREDSRKTNVSTEEFVWDIACAIPTLSWIHLSFKDS